MVLFSFFCFTTLVAQEPPDNMTMDDLRALYGEKGDKDRFLVYEAVDKNIQGSPFLNEKFQYGQIKLKGKKRVSDTLRMNIDLEKHIFLFEMSDSTYGFLPNSILAEIRIYEPNKVIFRPYSTAVVEGVQGFKLRLYEVLYDNTEIVVLKKYFRYLDKVELEDKILGGQTNNTYKTKRSFFIRTQRGKKYEKIKLSKKSIIKALKPQHPNIDKLIKENNLNVSKETSFIELLNKL